MRDYRQFLFWRKSHELAKEVYFFTKKFPRKEVYGISSQLRRATLSIPTNIAEGCGRQSNAEFKRFLTIASGSAAEAEYLLFFAWEISLLQKEQYESLNNKIVEIKKMLTAYNSKI